jgi:hypothetical protein
LIKRVYISFTFFWFCVSALIAQTPADTLRQKPPRPALSTKGSPFISEGALRAKESFESDSISSDVRAKTDTTPDQAIRNYKDSVSATIVYSKDSLDAPVDYGAKDSIFFDNANNLVHLYGEAYVNYNNLKLTAAYIVVDMKNNIATAEPLTDTTGKKIGLPNFKDGTQDVSAGKMRYNFKTRKGIILEARSKQNDVFILGSKSKFLASNGDTTQKRDDIVYSKNAIFTTCSAEHPHFGITSSKQKVIPNKLIVVGPSNIVIGDVPTPLWLPFAAFPLKQGKSTGLIFPRNYEYSPLWGFGLQGIGWYFPLGEHYDLTLQGDIYVTGTWGLKANSRYVKNYKSRGELTVGFSSSQLENREANIIRNNSWNVRWTHNQDQRANPTFTFGSSVDMQGSKSNDPLLSNYGSITSNSFDNATRSQRSSSITFTKTFPGRPYSLSGSALLTQNVVTRQVTAELPNLDFTMQTLFPFKQKKRVGNERWFEKIALQYNSQLRNSVQTSDSLLFTNRMFENTQFGVQHRLSSNVNFNILKYFNFTPSVSYAETWYLKEQSRRFDPTNISFRRDTIWSPDSTDFTIRRDTFQNGKVDTVFKNGFYRPNQFSIGASLTTRIFGTMQFKRGALRGIRHSVSPSFSFNYSPNYIRYYDSVQTTNSSLLKQIYSRYDGAIYGTPSAGGQQMALGYNLINLFEIKTFQKRDSTFKKIKLLEAVNISGNYNFLADSFRFSDVTMSTGTNLFKGLTTLGVNTLFSPYGRLTNNRRSREFALKENKRLLTFLNANVNLNTGISIGQIVDLFSQKEKTDEKLGRNTEGGQNANPSGFDRNNSPSSNRNQKRNEGESLYDMFKDFRLNHVFSINFDKNFGGRDTVLFQNSLYTQGNIQLSKKWTLRIDNIGYDFVSKQITYPSLGFARDLHCWEMGANWQPSRGTYSFYLRVKPGTLDFIKVPYGQNVQDTQLRRF